jgi:hypothetical protein
LDLDGAAERVVRTNVLINQPVVPLLRFNAGGASRR